MIYTLHKILLFSLIGFSSNIAQGNSSKFLASSVETIYELVVKTVIPKDIGLFVRPTRKVYHPRGSQVTAHHESGHAVMAHNMKYLGVKSIEIDGYAGAVEFEQFIDPIKDEDIKSFIMICLAGPVAEYEFNFAKKTRFISFDDSYKYLFKNGEWSSDMRHAYDWAMVLAQNYCEKHYEKFDQKMVKQEADRILKDCYRQTLIQVHAQRSDIQAVALVVIEKKSISGKTFYAIMRERKRLE